MLLGLCQPAQREAFTRLGYVDLGADIPGAGRVRANVSRQATGLKGSFRLVRDAAPTLGSLGLPEELQKVTSYHQGLAVVAGPSGHGKTTTLAALVDGINEAHPFHIITIEDPVEFVHPRKRAMVSQREVGTHTRSYATALKAALREDPDVIVIGELRDRETVEIALTAAETGHLVLATMSTPSAAKTIDRLIELFPPEDQPQVRATLAGTLKFVLAQRLLRGHDGMVPAAELVTGSTAVWTLIRENKLFQLPSLLQRGRAFGMVRFDDSLAELVRRGALDLEVARQFAHAPGQLEAVIAALDAPPPSSDPTPEPGRGRLGNLLRRS
jgi:twitching motility protein PilT